MLLLVHMGVMMGMMQSLVPLVQILQMDLPSLRRKRWQSGWQGRVAAAAAAVMQKLERVVERLQVPIHVLSVSGSFVKVLNRGGGGSRTPALRVSVVGKKRTSVQSQADLVMVGTSDQGGLQRRERNVRTTGSLRVAQSQVLRSSFCPAGFENEREGENVRSQRVTDTQR